MRAGPVSAAAMRVPVPAADQHAPFLHAHCDEAEYAAFLDGLALRPAVRLQRRNWDCPALVDTLTLSSEVFPYAQKSSPVFT